MTEPYPVELGTRIPKGVRECVRGMKDRARSQGREDAMHRLRCVRRGEFAQVWPDQFNEEFPTAIVANFVDVAARDLAANLSPLPSLACAAGQMKTDSDRRRAERKNRIGHDYWRHSRLQTQMKYGADQYLSYGFLPFWVEADYKRKKPLIHVEDPIGAYYELNRWLECVKYARCWRQDIADVAAMFPEYAGQILRNEHGYEYTGDTEVVRYIDDVWVVIYLPERAGLTVAAYKHGMDFCPVHIALRPGVELDPRGQFDDVLWVQLAHSVMAALTLEAGHKAVQAPITAPMDVQEISIGPDAVIQTDHGDQVRRIPLDVPAAAFALGQQLQEEMKEGAGYPDTRFGNGPAGGTTGRGVSALEGGFDTQIKLGQDVIGEALRVVTEMCFKMDAALWPNVQKTISGTLSGESFKITYQPGTDLADTTCEVTYGFAAGVSTSNAIVTLLQLRGDNIIDRDTFRRNLPFDIDADAMHRSLDVQQFEDGVVQGLLAGLQATGQMIAAGQQQTALTFFQAAVEMIRGRRNGTDMADLIDQVLVQPIQAQLQQAQQAAEQQAEAAAGGVPGEAGGGGDGELPGVFPNGLPAGVSPGQAGLPPGGRPTVLDLTSGFTGSGKTSMGTSVRRRIATGA